MKSILVNLGRKRLFRSLMVLTGIATAIPFTSAPAAAHAFGARYDLPLPLDLYLAGAGSAVALSFVIMVVFFRVRSSGSRRSWYFNFKKLNVTSVRLHPAFMLILQSFSVGIFLLILAAGLFGTQETMENIAPISVWILWWVGLAYVVALVGNIWPTINPWSITFSWIGKLALRIRPSMRQNIRAPYPSGLGVWPAVALFGWFAWFETLSVAANIPRDLAVSILSYSVYTWLCMAVFGRQVWLAHGEPFSLAFDVYGRFAPIGRPARDATDTSLKHWHIRPYASALSVGRPCSFSMTCFVLLMLATVTFDGFMETPLWGVILQWIVTSPSLEPIILGLHNLGIGYVGLLKTCILVAFPAFFLLIYFVFAWLTKIGADSERQLSEVAGLFVWSLVPIAIAYHLAHYLTYLLVTGQNIIPLLSDPFGFGWNLFGTASYRSNIAIINAKFAWYSAVLAIVIGHIFAVVISHFIALRAFSTPQAALRSQYPFLILMVAYTMVSLWILAQPIVETPSLATLTARSGTVTLEPRQIREACTDLVAQEEVQFEFQTDTPVKFDIHYHDGLVIRYPLQIDDITARSGTFLASAAQTYCLMWSNQSADRMKLTYQITGP